MVRSFLLVASRVAAGMVFAVVGTIGWTSTTAPAVSPSACRALRPEARLAIRSLVEGRFPRRDGLVCGLRYDEPDIQVLRSSREEVIPCLLDVARHGLAQTTLWSRSDGPPDARRWSLGVIGRIDPILAIRLYGKEVSASKDRWDQLSLRLSMLQFGDRASADAIVEILLGVELSRLRPDIRETAAESRVLEAISVLVSYDDRDALPILKEIQSSVRSDRPYLDVWVAQLERDLPALERFARDGAIWSFALDSLARVGAREILERFASDRKFHGHENARMLLDKGLPPLPPALDAASPCIRLDDRGMRELAYWVVDRFPPPGYRGSDCGTQSLPFGLMAQKEIASTCLEDIYRRGLTGTGIWSSSAPEPYPGALILGFLGPIDPNRAALLWREWRDSPSRTRWQQGYADSLRLGLGDTDAISGAVTYLRVSLDTLPDKANRSDYLIEELAVALIRVDHRPALSLLEKWRTRGELKTGLFDIGLAQLGRDATELERLARESNMAGAAISALGFVGAMDPLKRLADDANYKYRYLAMNELEKRR